MGKRGRDDDAGGASGATALAAPADDRVRLYHAHRQHLNKLFLADIDRKIKEDPSRILDAEVASYVKHSKSLRVRPLSRALPFPSFRAFGRDRAGSRNPHDLARPRTFPSDPCPPLDLSTSPRTFPDVSLPPRHRDLRQTMFADVMSSLDRASSVALVAAGAAAKRGSAFVFGTGDAGQLGLGDDVFELGRPQLLHTIPSSLPVLKVACGGMHTIAIVEGGLVYSWGVNDEGALGRKAAKDEAGAESTPGLVKMPPGAAAVDVSTGDSHVAVATSDGSVLAWGTFRTSSGLWAFSPETQIARSPETRYVPETSDARVVSVRSGTDHVLALTAGGDAYSWGCGEKGRLGRLAQSDADNVSKKDFEAKSKLLTPSKVPNLPSGGVSAVVAGSYHCLAVAKNGTDVFGWGLNSYGQLGVPYDFTAAASNQLVYFPMRVDELSGRGFVDGDGGEAHTVMLSSAGKAYAFGRSAYGRLGLADVDPKDDEPHSAVGHVAGLPGRVVAVVAGSSNSGAVTESGEAYAWGYGDLYQLGRGKDDSSDAFAPEKIKATKKMEGKRVAALSFGGQHAALVAVEDAAAHHAAKRARE